MLRSMERAPLRPVPSRPPGPVDPAEAMRYVEGALPQLDETGVAALALVQLAGCSREEAAERAGLPLDETGAALARARKELRRSRMALPGSGWCERAELMISDRLDGQLEPPGPDRLAVHLRNCPRCVDHERRLAQAIDALVEDFVGEAERLTEAAGYLPAPELADAGPEPSTPELAVVDAPERGPAPVAASWRAVALPPLKEREQAVALEAPAPPAEDIDIAAALAEDIVAAPPADSSQPVEPEPEPESEPAVEPARATVPTPLTGGLGVAWTVLFALAVALAVGAVAIAVVGLLGGSI
jgi:putative zinc finger protein